MATINFTVQDHSIRADNQIELAQASNNYDSCKFEFDSSWSGFNLYAVMYQDPKNVFKKQLDSSNTCKIPEDVLKKSGYLYIGARGEKADKTIATSVLFKIKVSNGAIDGNETGQEILNESQYKYLLGKISQLSEENAELRGDLSNKVGWAKVTGSTLYLYADKAMTSLIQTVTLPSGGSGGGSADGNTTYTFAISGNVITVTDSDGGKQTITLPSAVTDSHINSLIDAKLGVIENGTY